MNFTYLAIDIFTIFFPLALSFDSKVQFYKQFKPLFQANLVVASIFIAWDILFTHIGVWGFNNTYLTGISFFNLPIEEVLFFFCVPFACIFTFACVEHYLNVKWTQRFESIFVNSFSICLLAIGLYLLPKLYTSSTFISLAIVLLVLKHVAKVDWIPKIFTTYAILLGPFFIVNGILTGTGLENPIVWYNDDENIGIRLLTIPIEDMFYGFELVILNLFFVKIWKTKAENKLN
jgi:lycopene cyclase domain-containing protein